MTKKQISTINPQIRKQIETDIYYCELEIKNGAPNSKLFRQLEARYSLLDKNFFSNMPNYAKTFTSNYVLELEYVKTRLETYLLLDSFPVEYNQNIAIGVNIQTQKLVNKGNIGNNNDYNKSTTVTTELSVNGSENKKGFWGKLFHKK